IDAPATAAQKAMLAQLSPEQVRAKELAGDPIEAMLTKAPGNGVAIGGLKVVTRRGWFAARPSGTEDVYKLYAESFEGQEHLHQIQEEAGRFLADVFAAAGASGARTARREKPRSSARSDPRRRPRTGCGRCPARAWPSRGP